MLTCDYASLETAVSYPASDPFVTAVGGTALTADAETGEYSGETAWNDSMSLPIGTGGGYSTLYPRPAYQATLGNKPGRGLPDLSLNASRNGGVLVLFTDPISNDQYFSALSGTSVGAPEFAGLVAVGVQLQHKRLGFLNASIYRLGNTALFFNDITSGSNILFSSGVSGYTTTKKWDAVTGWGSPRDPQLFFRLVGGNLHAEDAQGL
jgi:kumamolisin